MSPPGQTPSNSGPLPRQEVQDMRAYSAPLEGRRKFLRLDFNENTIGPSPLVIKALRNIPTNHFSIYPEYSGLREALIDNLAIKKLSQSLKPSQIGIFNGVDSAINAIFHSYGQPGDLLLSTTPTFGYYEPCAQMQGMEILPIPYERESFDFPWQKINSILLTGKPRILLICNPNNPTGTRLSPEKILTLAKASPTTLIVIDELYEAFSGDSILPIVNFNITPNILVLRSLSKTAGLAGLRIGFAIGNSTIIEQVNRVTGPYDVNSFAVTAAFAALADQDYIDQYVSEVIAAKNWMNGQLQRTKLSFHIDGGNYFLIWPKRAILEMIKLIKSEGILVRSMHNKPLLNGALRVSIGTKEQMQKFWQAYSKHEKSFN